jgi:leader peptidase (prepilin peptidase)/N-methyltransferase
MGVKVAGWAIALLAAPFAGSFLYVLIRRLPRDDPQLWGRSRCETCHAPLGPLELLPIVSFLALRGRCRHCDARIAHAHLAVELAALGVAALVVASGARDAELWEGCALGWTLLALGWIDWEHFYLPDVLTLPLIVAGLGFAWLDAPDDLTDRSVGAIVGYLVFRLLALGYRLVRGREGLGQGDAKLLAAAGAWLGWTLLGDVVLLAALLGLGLALLARLRGVALHGATALPFGPALAAAIFIRWLAAAWQG